MEENTTVYEAIAELKQKVDALSQLCTLMVQCHVNETVLHAQALQNRIPDLSEDIGKLTKAVQGLNITVFNKR